MKFLLPTLRFGLVCSLLATASTTLAFPDLESHPGKAIYKKLCIDCHGAQGEGNEDTDPLEGTRSIESLAGKITRTMPEDEEHLCVGEDAKAVAEYIYHAFYSPEARARNTPPRIELARLTVPQFKTSVADVVGSFRNDYHRWYSDKRGFTGNYYGTRGYGQRKELREKKKKDHFKREDPLIKFDFGEEAPKWDPEMTFAKQEFSIRWQGTLLPPETGKYEFVIRTRNGAELWVNRSDRGGAESFKTIDAYVAPNNEIREERGSAYLIGGRAVPIRLDFFKYKEKAAFIELLWKTPHGELQTIPTWAVAPDWLNPELVISTPFPPDDRSVGYERGTAVSKAWLEATTAGAIEAAEYVTENLTELAGLRNAKNDKERWDKTGHFCVQFVERAFRRPLTPEEIKRFVTDVVAESSSPEQGAKRVALMTFKDPRFLYPGLSQKGEEADDWDRINRISLALWDSVPPKELREAAKKGKVKTQKEIEDLCWWLMGNPRARAKLHGFYNHWLELDRAHDISKDKAVFPEYSPELMTDLRLSLYKFLDGVVFSEKSDYRELLQADYLWVNKRLAKVYGIGEAQIPQGKFEKVSFDPKRRAGLVTHPFLLTSYAYHNNTSPIHRGVFLTRNIVGMSLNSPEMANEFVEGNFDPNQTMREKVEDLTRAKACMACHTTINPLGFSLEHFDGLGRWRWKEKEKPINAKSDFTTDSGETIKITGARDVANFAANRQSAHDAFIEQLFHHLVKQPMLAYGPDVPTKLREDFRNSGFNIRYLMVRIAAIAAGSD